ncbi:MAG: bifunctional metallophosphatase/5'-nucleotidase [Candidatus Cryptobacteroides sp.]
MKPILKLFTVACAVIFLMASSCKQTAQPGRDDDGNVVVKPSEDKEFVILFTNDFHSQIDPVASNGRGGALRLKALVDSVRAAEPLVILADAGDFVQGSFYFSLLDGVVEAMILDEMKYDVRTIGNHEFDKKIEGMDKMFSWSRVPVVSTNYNFSSTILDGTVLDSYMYETEDLKVGFVGMGVRLAGLVSPVSCAGVEYVAPVEVVDAAASELKKRGADIVIGLSHLGCSSSSTADYYDRGFAAATKNVDMIIGGHTHTALYKAVYVRNLSNRIVPIVQTGSRGYNLGYAKVKLPAGGTPTYEYRLIPVTDRLEESVDQTFAAKLSVYLQQLEAKVSQVIGTSEIEMRTGNHQGLLGNWATDSMVEMAESYFGVRPDLAVCNNGGLRAPMPKGEVKVSDIYAIFPFDNTMTLLTLTGDKMLELFDFLAKGGYPFSSDVRMTVRGGTVESLTLSGKPISRTGQYKVATINYLADDKIQAFNNPVSREDSADMVRDYYVEYVRGLTASGKTIKAEYDDRITVIE